MVKSQTLSYFVFQLERGESGTPHFQGYLVFVKKQRLTACQRLISNTAHYEGTRGGVKANYDYCTKADGRLEGPFVGGERPVEAGSSQQLEAATASVIRGSTLSQVAIDFPTIYLRHHRGLTALRNALTQPRPRDISIIWLHGPTGVGKTRAAFQRYPQAYFKPAGKWFDGYDQQKVVIWDDFRPSSDVTLAQLLRITDRYPVIVEYKGGFVAFNALLIIFTSPLAPGETYAHEDITQLTRRITQVVDCSNGVPEIVWPQINE